MSLESRSSGAALRVVELARRGKFLVGEPYFEPGPPILLDRKGLEDARPGDLAVRGRPAAGAPGWSGCSAGRTRSRPCSRACSSSAAPCVRVRAARSPPEPSLEGRVDLRDQLTFTIDPETAKDFDDAIAVRPDGDGLRAWVHIADVSYFVPAGTPLDHGAAERALSTYVPGLVAPMLPHELADDLCSLRPHQDRLCVTVEVPFSGRRARAGRAGLLPLGDPQP